MSANWLTHSAERPIPSPTAELGRREREILESLFRLGEASVADVRADLAQAPSYSAVRTMLGHLEAKGFVTHRPDGRRFLYAPRVPIAQARRSALQHVLDTFFEGSEEALVTMLVRRGELAGTVEGRQRLLALLREIENSEDPE